MWTCPDCGRKFARNKQSHSCISYDPQALFAGKDQKVIDLYRELLERVNEFGEVEVHYGKWNVTIRHLSTFLSVMIERTHLTLVFISDQGVDEFPVYQSNPYSANRFANAVKIESPDEIDDQLLRWLRHAWEMAV